MFEHQYFEKREATDRIGSTVFIMSEKHMAKVEAEWLKHFSDDPSADPIGVGTVSAAEIVSVNDDIVDIQYILDRQTRFHSIKFHIPRTAIKNWIGIYWNFDHKYDYVFVDDDWHETFWNGHISTFLLVDAIGIKKKMYSDSKQFLAELNQLSAEVDLIAKKYPALLFLSAADNIIVKANFSPRAISPIYNPELLLTVCEELNGAIRKTLNCDSYGIFTQGFNYYNDLTIYSKGEDCNHINTRSLGEPFKDLMQLETVIREDLRNKRTVAASAYFSPDYFFSLNIERKLLNVDYREASKLKYVARNLNDVIEARRKERYWE